MPRAPARIGSPHAGTCCNRPHPCQVGILVVQLGSPPVCVVGDASCWRLLVMMSFFALSLHVVHTDGWTAAIVFAVLPCAGLLSGPAV
jgi:hypothetical protein